MTPEQQAAYIVAQAACANARVAAMVAENQMRAHRGESPAYVEDHFDMVANDYGIHHNAVLTFFRS